MKKKKAKRKVKKVIAYDVPLKYREESLDKWERIIWTLEKLEDSAGNQCGYCRFVWDAEGYVSDTKCSRCPLSIKGICGYDEERRDHLHGRICKMFKDLIHLCGKMHGELYLLVEEKNESKS